MSDSMSNKEKQMIINFGALGYAPEICEKILGWEKSKFTNAIKNQSNDIFKAYEEGTLKADYVIDLKLFEQAQQGDIKALNKLEQRKRARK